MDRLDDLTAAMESGDNQRICVGARGMRDRWRIETMPQRLNFFALAPIKPR